jgi:hypothetical protein
MADEFEKLSRNKLAALASAQKKQLVTDLEAFAKSNRFLQTLSEFTPAATSALLAQIFTDKALEFLSAALQRSPLPTEVQALEGLLQSAEVVNEIIAALDTTTQIKAVVTSRWEVVQGTFVPAVVTRLKTDLDAYLDQNDSNGFTRVLKIAKSSLEQVRATVEAAMLRDQIAPAIIENLISALDWRAFAQTLESQITTATTALSRVAEFPFPGLRKVARVAQDLVEQFARDKVAFLQNLPEALHRIDSEIQRLRDNPIATITAEIGQLKKTGDQAIQAANAAKSEIDGLITTAKARARLAPSIYGDYVLAYFDRATFLIQLEQWAKDLTTLRNDILAKFDILYAEVLAEADPLLTQLAGLINKAKKGVEEAEKALPTELSVNYAWEPALMSSGGFEASRNGKAASFVLNARIRKSLKPSELSQPATIEVDGRLGDFQLNFLPSPRFITVSFKEVHFLSKNGGAPAVKVKLDKVEFGEALKFVQELAKALSPDSGSFLDLNDGGLQAGYRFAVPNITSGGFNLVQVSINTSVMLPFDGSPVKVRFSLSERNRPFLLSVGILGGGGFLAVEVNSKNSGVDRVEGSLEFGAIAALDLGGFASGVVSITAGIYFEWAHDSAAMTGFVRAAGTLRVIGLISISAMFYLGLGDERRDGKTSPSAKPFSPWGSRCYSSASVSISGVARNWKGPPTIRGRLGHRQRCVFPTSPRRRLARGSQVVNNPPLRQPCATENAIAYAPRLPISVLGVSIVRNLPRSTEQKR